MRPHLRTSAASLLATSVGLAVQPARADEPLSATEPQVMMEAGEVTQVISRPAPGGRPAGVNVSLGFSHESKSANIFRETVANEPGLTTGAYTSRWMNVAQYEATTSRLVPRLDLALWHDIGLYVRAPIVLNFSQSLGDLAGTQGKEAVVFQGAPGETLGTLPFKSPDRSGLEYLAAGLEFDVFNQARDRSKPTWRMGLEGRFSVGTPMHACTTSPKAGQIDCADPSDINRDGKSDPSKFEGTSVARRDPGVSRGTIGLEAHTILSKRIKYLEPYGGFSALFEFQRDSSDYGFTDLDTSLVNHPPLIGTMIVGLMVIPWENRERFSRLTLDTRFTGSYHSEGREYSELFDFLGSSDAASLRVPQYAKYTRNPNYSTGSPQPISVVDPASQKTFFTGLSDVAAYGSYRASFSLTWQAALYFKLHLGVGFRHDQAHGISGDQPCNPDFKDDLTKSGPCHASSGDQSAQTYTATGVPNPNYRASINSVGRRFFVDDSNTYDVSAGATFMF
jgi:hypothetical protein